MQQESNPMKATFPKECQFKCFDKEDEVIELNKTILDECYVHMEEQEEANQPQQVCLF